MTSSCCADKTSECSESGIEECCQNTIPDESPVCGCCNPYLTEKKEKSEIFKTDTFISFKDRLDYISARLGINRMGHIVKPGLYRLGNPGPDSEVFVTANYTLSFNALRKSLHGFDAWILVLDTKGVNVWCAAGKGTFSTKELINRITITGLSDIINHKKLIMPRLSAPGVNANEVLRKTGFHIIWGTIRSSDIPEFLNTGIITPEMKEVTFPLKDRMALTPIEFLHFLPYFIIPAIILAAFGLWGLSGKLVLTLVAGTLLFPALLYILPFKDFTIKGLILGLILMCPVIIAELLISPAHDTWFSLTLISDILIWPALTGFLALNFTGSSTFTSRSGAKREIKRYIRPLLAMAVSGIILAIAALATGGVI